MLFGKIDPKGDYISPLKVEFCLAVYRGGSQRFKI